MYISNNIIKYVAENIRHDRHRFKFNWDDFGIKLNAYYTCSEMENMERKNLFIIKKIRINKFADCEIFLRLKSINYVDSIYLVSSYDFDKYIDFILKIGPKKITFGRDFNYPLDKLKSLTNLECIYLDEYFAHPIDVLQNFKKLKKLCLINRKFRLNLNFLENLPELTHLVVSNIQLDRCIELKKLKSLTILSYNSQDSQYLQNMKNLEYIDLRAVYMSPLVLDFLRECKKIEHIILFGNNISSIDQIENCINLRTLEICSSYRGSLKSIENLKNLKKLSCSITDNSKDSIKYLDSLRILKVYNFNGPLDDFRYLKDLEVLEFDSNFNQDLTPLKELKNLKILSLGNSFDKDISPLKHLKNLRELNLGYGFRSTLEPIKHMKNLNIRPIYYSKFLS